jgi:hypothetical protein
MESKFSNSTIDLLALGLRAQIVERLQRRFWLRRVVSAMGYITRGWGALHGFFACAFLVVSSLVGLALAVFCMEGVTRSFLEVGEDMRYIVHVRYLGDAGGWMSLAIFCVVAVKIIWERIMAEGEWVELSEICNDCHDWKFVLALFMDARQRCFFRKSIATTYLTAIEACKHHTPPDIARLQQLLEDIAFCLQREKIRLGRRCCLSWGGIRKRGCCAISVATVFGLIFPIALAANVVLSLVGEVGLGYELFIERDELTDIGHFGEWPINAIEAAVTGVLFLSYFLLSDGDYEFAKYVYIARLHEVDDNVSRQALVDVATNELMDLAGQSGFRFLPPEFAS